MYSVLLTTTGVCPSPVVIDDLGGRAYYHPTVDYDIGSEFSLDELAESADLQLAIDNNCIVLTDENGNPIDDVRNIIGGGVGAGGGNGFCLHVSKDYMCEDVYLRGGANTTTYLSPFLLPFNADLIAMSVSAKVHTDDDPWSIEVYRNSDIVGNPNVANAVAVTTLPAYSEYKREVFDPVKQLDDQDKLAVYLRGDDVQYPRVLLFFRKR